VIEFIQMKLFTIGREGKLIPYREKKFEQIKQEADLEDILENNPEYFLKIQTFLLLVDRLQRI